MRRAVTWTLQLYHPVDETFVSLSFFDVFRNVFSEKKTSNFHYEKTGFSAFFFPENFLSEVEFFCRVVKM